MLQRKGAAPMYDATSFVFLVMYECEAVEALDEESPDSGLVKDHMVLMNAFP